MCTTYRSLSPAARDRLLQQHLAAARGPALSGRLLRSLMNTLLRNRFATRHPERVNHMPSGPMFDAVFAVVEAFGRCEMNSAMTGSMVSSHYGESVASLGVDFLVMLDERQARLLSDDLSPRFYCNAEAVAEIARTHGMVNIIDNATGLKIDLSHMKRSPFREAIFARASEIEIGGPPAINAVSPEDIILMKLDWRRDSQSQKQWDNALSVVRVRGARLDWKYLFEQARALQLEADVIKLRDEGGV